MHANWASINVKDCTSTRNSHGYNLCWWEIVIINLRANPIFNLRMKHIAVDFDFGRDQVQESLLPVSLVSSKDQLVDALTKPLTRQCLHDSRVKTYSLGTLFYNYKDIILKLYL